MRKVVFLILGWVVLLRIPMRGYEIVEFDSNRRQVDSYESPCGVMRHPRLVVLLQPLALRIPMRVMGW